MEWYGSFRFVGYARVVVYRNYPVAGEAGESGLISDGYLSTSLSGHSRQRFFKISERIWPLKQSNNKFPSVNPTKSDLCLNNK